MEEEGEWQKNYRENQSPELSARAIALAKHNNNDNDDDEKNEDEEPIAAVAITTTTTGNNNNSSSSNKQQESCEVSGGGVGVASSVEGSMWLYGHGITKTSPSTAETFRD